MKKLKLKLDGVKETLSREQMKKISGGYTSTCLGIDDITCDYPDIVKWTCHFIEQPNPCNSLPYSSAIYYLCGGDLPPYSGFNIYCSGPY